jgi:hypothetical protein
MTETAKQGTAKAPAQAAETGASKLGATETESAATQGEAQQETTAEGGETAEAKAGTSAKPELDDTKRKFREALDRKHQVHNDAQAKGGRDGGKISGAHGPAASRRNFRRKSG